jgi:L-lactate dehydrogenase complex protein LldG
MDALDSIIGRIRRGLHNGAEPAASHAVAQTNPSAPAAPGPDHLCAQFVAAFTAVGGQPVQAANESAAVDRLAELMRVAGVRSAAIGQGITTDSDSAAARLSREGFNVSSVSRANGLAGFKETLSAVDAGIVEADYAIAPTGTVVLIGQPSRPRSLSLLPPINIVLLRTGRILPDLAAVLRAVGPQTMADHPMVMVTGPSRTADIEKRIVIGVHGPKELYVVLIPDDSSPAPR